MDNVAKMLGGRLTGRRGESERERERERQREREREREKVASILMKPGNPKHREKLEDQESRCTKRGRLNMRKS